MPSPESFDDEYDDEALEEVMAKKNAKRSLANRIGTGLGVSSLGVNAAVLILMFLLSSSTIAYVSLAASAVAIVVALVVVKRQIIDMAPTHTLRYVHNKLRRKVHHLYLANNQLTDRVDALQVEIGSLQDVEAQLGSITKQQGKTVDELVRLVRENAGLLNDMTKAIRANATMSLVDLALDSDRDESSLFSETEIESLLARLANVDGIDVNESVLRTKLKDDNSLQGVLAMLNHAAKYAKQQNKKGGTGVVAGEDEPVFTFQVVAQ